MLNTGYEVRLESGHAGLAGVGVAGAKTLIVVDVLSFSTAVSVAVERGALVFPYPWQIAAALDASEAVPALTDGCYRAREV